MLTVQANGVLYERSLVSEWYVNDERGIEHGFTLSAPPQVSARGMLALDLSFSGTLTASLADTESTVEGSGVPAIEFTSPAGQRVLRYDQLW